MSEGKRRSFVDWKRLKEDIHTRISTRDANQQTKLVEQAQVAIVSVSEHEDDRVSFETALTSTETNGSVKTLNKSIAESDKRKQSSVSSVVKGVGDAIRLKVKESWNSRAISPPPQPEAELNKVPAELQENESKDPPRLPPRPPLGSIQSLPVLTYVQEGQLVEGTTQGLDVLALTDTQAATASDTLLYPAALSLPGRESSDLLLTRTFSAPATVATTHVHSALVSNAAEQDESGIALIPISNPETSLVSSEQGQELQVEQHAFEESSPVRSSSTWLIWSMIGQQLQVDAGILPYVQDVSPACELCEERLIMNGHDDGMFASLVYVCETCGQFRILCERCARSAINLPQDPHEADHILQRVGPITLYSLKSFVDGHDLEIENQDESTISISQSWLDTDLAFRAPAEAAAMLVRLFLRPPPGMHKMIVTLGVVFDEASISSEVIGAAAKQWMKTTKKPSGDISIGAEVVSRDSPSIIGMPLNTVRNPIVYKSGIYSFSVVVAFVKSIPVNEDQGIRLHIKTTYNDSIFKAGCPFSWQLKSIRMEEYGEGKYLATKGQLLRQAKDAADMKTLEKRDTRDRRIGYVGTAIGLGTGAAGLAPVVQGLGAVLRK